MARTLIKNGFVITMDSANRIIEKGAVAISGNKIVAVGKEADVTKGFKADETIDAKSGIIMPGFICNHCHTHAQGYMGSPEYPLGENPTFLEILGRGWWPKLEDILTKEDVYHVAKYTSMLMMKWGFTYVFDVMEAPNSLPGVLDSEAKALEELGMRGTVVQEATERISNKNAELGIQENLKFAKKCNFKKDALVKGALCGHTVWTCSKEMLQRIRDLANKEKIPINMHVNESPFEYDWARKTLGKGSFEYLDEIGVLGPDFLASQCVQTTPEEVEVLAKNDVKVAHNVQSNTCFADGFAPVPLMLKKGVTVGLGNDGFFLDPFENLRVMQHVHRGYTRDISILSSRDLLAIGTIDNAKTVWQDKEIGSLEIGKKADLIIFNIKSGAPVDTSNLLDLIMYKAYGTQVSLTMIDGQVTARNQKVLTCDEEKVRRDNLKTAQAIWDRGAKTPLPEYQYWWK